MKIKRIIKYVFIAFVTVVLAFFALRIFMTDDRGTLDEVYPSEGAVKTYGEAGADSFVTYKIPYDMSEDGYYTAYSPVYIKDAKEFQITVRYNDSLYEKFLKNSTPSDYYFELRDADGKTVAKADVVAEKERYFYNYLRLSFTDIIIDGESELYLFLCCDVSDPPYPADHNKGIIIKHPSFAEKTVKLSKSEIEALSK